MEAVAELDRPSENGSSLLILPGSCPWEDDDEPLGLGGIKPKSSPIPRRRSSESCCSEDDSQPPPSISRRVSFADAFGLSLVSVKQFDSWALRGPSGPLERDLNKEQDHFLSLFFTLPQTPEELLWRVREQKLELESLALLPGTTTLKGTIRVLNLCFDKLVFIRMSLDSWRSHFDLLAEYVPGLSYGDTDCFSFKLTLVPPFGKHGVRVDFCLRYETPLGNFWANNNGQNYVLFCCEKAKVEDENEGKYKRKSCLKSTSLGSSSKTSSTSSADNIPEIVLNCGSAVNTEPVQKKAMQEECIKLQEENIRNHSRRTKRRAEQQAKVQQYFAQTEEKDFEKTGASTREAAAMTHGNEWTPAKGQMVSKPSTPETDVGREMNERPAELLKVEGQERTPGSVDTGMQVPAFPIKMLDMVNIPALHPEVTTARYEASSCPTDSVNHHKVMESSVPQALAISQDKETIPSQTVSVAQHLLSSDMSVSMCVEKVWECFEKSAGERIVSTDNTSRGQDPNIAEGKASHGGSAILESDLRIQPLGQTFTFETVVAPLYHQVFERIEMERRDIMSRGIHAQGPAGNCKDGSLREVTYQSYPSAPNEKASPNVCMSKKHVVNDVHHEACKETFPQNVLSVTKNANPCLRLNNKLIAEMDANTSLTEFPEDTLHGHFSESNILQTVTATKEQHLKYTLPLQQEHSQNYTLTWEKETKETPDRFIFQNKLSEDIEYSLDNMSVQGEYSEHSHQDPKPAASEALSAQCDSDSTTAKTSLSIVSKNLPILDGTLNQISCETRFSSDVALTQTQNVEGTNTLEGLMFTENLLFLPPSNKSQEECHAPILHFTMFPDHLSGFRQCDAPTLSHNLNSQATTQIQNPGSTSLKTSQKAAGTHDQSQITECTNQTEESDNLQCYSKDDSHCVFWDLESNDRNNETDECEKNKTDISLNFATKTRQAEKLHNNPEKILNAQHINQIYENEEHKVLDSDLSYRAVDFNVILAQNKATLTVSTNTDPEGSSTKKDNEQNVDKSKEQISLNMKESVLEEHKQEEEQQNLPKKEGQEPPPQEKEQQKSPQEKEQQKSTQEKGPQELPQEKGPQETPPEKEQQEPPQEKGKEPPQEKGKEPLQEKGQETPQEKGPQETSQEKGPQEPPQEKGQETPQEKGPQETSQEKGPQEPPQEKERQETPQEKEQQEAPTNEKDEAEEKQLQPQENYKQNEQPQEKGQEGQREHGGKEQQELDKEMQLCNEEHFEDELHYNDDRKAEEEKKEKDTGQIMEEWEDDDHLSLEGEIDEQKTVSGVKFVAVVEGNNNDNSLKNDHSLKQLCYKTEKHQSAEDTLSDVELLLKNEDIEEQDRNSLNEQSEKNMDDGRSTESLTDDDMELYLHCLKNTHQLVFRGCMSSGNHSKRRSINRTRTMPSPMPSISESMDEDQPNSSLEDLTNEETMQLERATLPLMYEEEKVIGRNVLWWREFFSSDNMSKMLGYTFLFLLFLLTAYYYDFIACLGLYILALYWLYFYSESESLKDK